MASSNAMMDESDAVKSLGTGTVDTLHVELKRLVDVTKGIATAFALEPLMQKVEGITPTSRGGTDGKVWHDGLSDKTALLAILARTNRKYNMCAQLCTPFQHAVHDRMWVLLVDGFGVPKCSDCRWVDASTVFPSAAAI